MGLSNTAKAKLVRYFDKRFIYSKHICTLYSNDFLRIPKSIAKLCINNIPDGIVIIENRAEILTLVRIATEEKFSIIPRGGSTTDTGASVPSNGGIIVDMTKLRGQFMINHVEQTITMNSGTVFSDIQNYLQLNGYSLYVYPSSLYSGTVGGWIANGGYGINSLKHGGIIDQITELEVVLPNGELKVYKEKNDFKMFIGANGVTGIITRVSLRIQVSFKYNYLVCSFDTQKDLMNGLKEISQLDCENIHFFNASYMTKYNQQYKKYLPESFIIIVSKAITYDEEWKTFQDEFNKLVRTVNAKIIDPKSVSFLWKKRYHMLSILKKYKNTVHSSFVFDVKHGLTFLERFAGYFDKNKLYEGYMISKNKCVIRLMSVNKTREHEKKAFLQIFKWARKSVKSEGHPLSTGLWFSDYYAKIYSIEKEKKLKQFKKEVDPSKICNKGKIWSSKGKILPIKISTLCKILSIFS